MQSGSMEEMGALWPDTEQKSGFPLLCHRYIATTLTGLLSLVAFLSPLAMLVLPKLGNYSIFNINNLVYSFTYLRY